MNRILLAANEVECGYLPASDRRCQHLIKIIRAQQGTRLRAGIVAGAVGELEIVQLTAEGCSFRFFAEVPPRPLKPLTLLLAHTRPPVLRRLLRDLASFACQQIYLFPAALSEGDYQKSHVWQQIPQLLIDGAQQGGYTTLLPHWQVFPDLATALQHSSAGYWCDCGGSAAAMPLLTTALSWPATIAIGPERGWSSAERRLALAKGWQRVSLGESVLRCELSCQLAVGLLCQRWEFAQGVK